MPSEIELETSIGEEPRRCWCGRPIPPGGRAVLVRPYPATLGILRDKPFHSPACVVAFAASMSTVMDAQLVQPVPERLRRELLAEREAWHRLIDRLTPVVSDRPGGAAPAGPRPALWPGAFAAGDALGPKAARADRADRSARRVPG